MSTSASIASNRAEATLLAGAMGDALGMPTQTLTPEEIATSYGAISYFVSPFDGHPVSHGLVAGSITDDTEQTILLAKRIIDNPESFDERAWAQDLLDWESGVKLRGLQDLLGPSTKQALKNLLAGMPPDQTGRQGTTNGASMRIAPVGIATPIEPLAQFLDHVETACRVTHNTREAISAAAAVATIISAGIAGADFGQAMPLAVKAATEATRRGGMSGVADIPARLDRVVSMANQGMSVSDLACEVGTSVASHESVVAAFGIVVLAEYDPWQAGLMSAVIGDDTDTIGAIAMSMAAACSGLTSLPPGATQKIQVVNSLDLQPIVAGLLQVRSSRTEGIEPSLCGTKL